MERVALIVEPHLLARRERDRRPRNVRRDELAANVARPRERRRGAGQQHFARGRERVSRRAQHVGEGEIEARTERVVGGEEAGELGGEEAGGYGRDPRTRRGDRGKKKKEENDRR